MMSEFDVRPGSLAGSPDRSAAVRGNSMRSMMVQWELRA